MKSFVCVLLLAAVVSAEPPRYRLARFSSEKQEVEGSGQASSDPQSAPYPAAGFRPSKEFRLPTRQELVPPSTSYGVPADSYGAPSNTYLAPQTEYGIPANEARNNDTKGDENQDAENGESQKSETKSEKSAKIQEGPKNDAQVISAQGAYYVLLPGSQLQRVQFQTENDIRNMAYTARLQYKSEDRAPIYVYTAVPQYTPSAAYVQLI